MTLQEKLIAFMKKKASFLPGIYKKTYFTEKDADAIRSWNNDYCNKVIHELLSRYRLKTDDSSCVFCQQSVCLICEYGRNHGRCSSDTSSYQRMLNSKAFKGKTISDFIKDHTDELLEVLK